MVCIAQLAESLIVVQVVVGSSPSAYPIKLPLYLSWPEHLICNPVVIGSNPIRGSKWRGGGIGRRATLRG